VPLPNRAGIRYADTVVGAEGTGTWTVRSWGPDFDIVDPSWRRVSRRWFSLGWGNYESEGVPHLLLAQAWSDWESVVDLRASVLSDATALVTTRSLGWSRLAAVLG
jgi:hypothetical protein